MGKMTSAAGTHPGNRPHRSADGDRTSAARLPHLVAVTDDVRGLRRERGAVVAEQLGEGRGGLGVFGQRLCQGGLQRLRVFGLVGRAFGVGDGLRAGGAGQPALDPAPDGLAGVGSGCLGGVLAEIEEIRRNERDGGGGEGYGVQGVSCLWGQALFEGSACGESLKLLESFKIGVSNITSGSMPSASESSR